MWVGNEHLNVPKAKQNLWVASLALKRRLQTFICLLADALVQNNVRLLAITLLFLIRAADMLSSVPKDMFKSDHVCDSIWTLWSCYESPYEALFIGIGATETPETVWERHNKNRRSISFLKQLFYITDVVFIVVWLFMRLFPLNPDSDLETLNGEVNRCLVKIKT